MYLSISVDGSPGELQSFKRNELDTLIESPYVVSYNTVGMNTGNIVDAEPYFIDEDLFNRFQQSLVSDGLEENDNSFVAAAFCYAALPESGAASSV